MLEQLQQIDTSVIDELMDVKRERETVADRLAKMGEDKEKKKVSDVVFRRVKRDYESRATSLERKAAPLKDRARGEYGKLKALLDRIESENSATKLDREEVDFRKSLGEFGDDEFDQKVSELDERLEEQEEQLTEIREVRERFVEAFDSEEELATVPAAPAPAEKGAAGTKTVEPPEAVITAPQPVEEPPPPPAAATPPPPPPAMDEVPPSDGTIILPPEGSAPPPPPPPQESKESKATPPTPGRSPTSTKPVAPATSSAPAAPPGGKTVVLSLAKLVAIDTDLGAPDFPLQPLTFVGRTPDNQVRLNKPAVSRRHAQLTQTPEGWSIKDLHSENGTYVNGEKIEERALADGDRVQIGTVRLVFRAG
jgi:hypothetical protein